jgi:predicted DNA-binding antitoxin AbrB/MazE fold protein
MPLTIEAIYENGVFKLTEPLPFKEIAICQFRSQELQP